ncbi:MAG: hypothetical protein ACOYJK_08995 [Prevotella sp.]
MLNSSSKTSDPVYGSPADARQTFVASQLSAFALRQRALARMSNDLEWLIAQPKGSVEWGGTRRDLVEMANLVWMQHTAVDECGCPYCRRELVRRAFAAVGLPVPANIERVVMKLRERTTMERSMLSRYQHLIDEPDIIGRFCKK